jgi:hypothetical protein
VFSQTFFCGNWIVSALLLIGICAVLSKEQRAKSKEQRAKLAQFLQDIGAKWSGFILP